jgi:hypothetical protein
LPYSTVSIRLIFVLYPKYSEKMRGEKKNVTKINGEIEEGELFPWERKEEVEKTMHISLTFQI